MLSASYFFLFYPMKALFKYTAFLAVIALLFSKFPPPPLAFAEVATSWNRKVEIVIQESKIDADLTNFPVLITKDNVPSEACDADGSYPAQNGGGDIRFTSDEAGNYQLPLDIVKFVTDNNPTNCDVEMYVLVTSVTNLYDTSIWMWYNSGEANEQPAADSTFGSESVWSGYAGAWNLNENSGTRYDQTGNDNDLTDNNTVLSTAGKTGTGADFERDNTEYLSKTDNSSLDITDDLSLSLWTKIESAPTTDTQFVFASKEESTSARSWFFRYEDEADVKKLTTYIAQDVNGNTDLYGRINQTLTPGTWYNLAIGYDASAGSVEFYVNGSSIGTVSSYPTSIANSTSAFVLGQVISTQFMDGFIDQVRLVGTLHSDAWVRAQYENENSPGTFAIEGTPVGGDTAPSESTVIKSADETVTSSTTLQNDNELTFTLNANTEYVLTGGIFATSTSGTPDIKIAYTVPTGATMDIAYIAQGGTNRSAELLETSGTASNRIVIPANGTTIIQPFGSIVTGANTGTLTLQWSQFVSNATASKVKQGSFISVTEAVE